MKKLFYLIVFLLFAVFAFTLQSKNFQTIPIRYYFNIDWQIPLFMLIMVPFFIGMVLGVLIMTLSVFKSKRQAGKANRELKKVEKEVQNFRAMPLQD